MRRLESEGLVIGDTHRGFSVVEPDSGRIEENFQIRAALSRWELRWPPAKWMLRGLRG